MAFTQKRDIRRKNWLFILVMIVVVYALVSGAIAINTVDACGDDGADKHWSLVPPEWVCD